MIAIALALLLAAQEVRETEPNDTRDAAVQEVAPGAVFAGSLTSGDHDWVHLACAAETVCSLELEIPDTETALLEIAFARQSLFTRSNDRPIRALRVRFPNGRTLLHLSGEARQYRLRIAQVAVEAGVEYEPNDGDADAIELREGDVRKGQQSGFRNEEDHFVIQVATAGPRELVFKRAPANERAMRARLDLTSASPNGNRFSYDITAVAEEYHFYPVLEPGTWRAVLYLTDDTPIGTTYEISQQPFVAKISAEQKAAATAAVERATKYLLQLPESRSPSPPIVAAESMVLAALAEGRGARERREMLDRDYVAWLAGAFQPVEGRTWQGREVRSATTNIYTHTMATLGLAEAAANGSAKARELAATAAEFLIATQATERKPKHWNGPVARQAPGHGGWRYAVNDNTADLSIQGWALVALTAVDAAGIQVEGMRDAFAAGLECVRRMGNQDGFGYERPGGGSNLHNSIGALVVLLHDSGSSAMGFATRQLDTHLWAATQVDRGDNYPFYYLYCATRAQYLRGGAAWETWRAVALPQLLRRQREDGSWAAIIYDAQPGPRWSTALGLMALRLCLDDPPRYLRVEAKGF
jgi:hypothetical protein